MVGLRLSIPTLNHQKLILWSLLSGMGSLIAFGDYYLSIVHLLSNWDFLMAEGSYPFVMLLFLVLWQFLSKRGLFTSLNRESSTLQFDLVTLVGFMISVSALTFKLFLASPPTAIQLILIITYFQGLFMMVFPKTGARTLLILALYIPTATLPLITTLYLDYPVAQFFIQTLMPVLHVMGLQVFALAQGLALITQSGEEVHIGINAACGGIASYSIFLFLNGLMLLDVRVPRKKAVLFTLTGLAILVLLNLFRLVVIVGVAYTDIQAINTVHNTLGYALFIVFYIVYTWFLLRGKRSYSTSEKVA